MNPRSWRLKTIPAAAGFLVSALLFLRCISRETFSGWEWYHASAFLAAIGLVGVFPAAGLQAVLGLITGPFVVSVVELFLSVVKDPTCCNLWPFGLAMAFVFALPAPIAAGLLGKFVVPLRLHRTVYFSVLGIALVVAVFVPRNRVVQQRQQWKSDAKSCTVGPGRPNEIYRDVCRYHDQFDSVLSCQQENGAAASELRTAGREAVNAYMRDLKPAQCN